MKESTITVGIVSPAPLEYESCCDILKLTNEVKLQGRLISSRVDKSIKINAIQSGPGKINSASATQLIIDRFEPDIVLDTGAAGSLSPKADIFDIVCAENAYEYDICTLEEFRNLAHDLTTSTILSNLPKETEEIFHHFIEDVMRENSIRIELGNIVSGERNVSDSILRNKLHSHFQAIACNWETSAILKTARVNEVKTLSFRVITDNAGEGMQEELRANWAKSSNVLYSVLEKFLLGGWLLHILGCFQEETTENP